MNGCGVSRTSAEKLADEHWKWLEKLLEYVYKTAFIHGYKHGVDDTESKSVDRR